MRTRIDIWLEWLLVIIFLYGGINVFLANPIAVPGYLSFFIGQAAYYIYAVLFFGAGLLLAYAKLEKKKKVHKYALLIMYLCCIYATVLNTMVLGITWNLTANVLVAILSGVLWVRWKSHTEYIDPLPLKAKLTHLRMKDKF